jgi:hypothetical protein
MGASLVAPGYTGSPFVAGRGLAIFGESGRWSLASNPRTGRLGLYDWASDPLQRRDSAAQHPDVVQALDREAKSERVLVDYLLEANRVWRPEVTRPSAESNASAP